MTAQYMYVKCPLLFSVEGNGSMCAVFMIVIFSLSLLLLMQTSNDIVVLCSALLVVTAILPLIPSYVGSHLQDLLGIFCTLATIKDTKRLGMYCIGFIIVQVPESQIALMAL